MIQSKDEKCTLDSEELIDILGVNKSEFLSKLHQQEEISNRPLVDFDNPTLLSFDNCSVLTDLTLHAILIISVSRFHLHL